MMLDAEQIKKALECCTSSDKTADALWVARGGDISSCEQNLMYHALALINLYETGIKAQKQKIFELENRLKECENGYEGTLALERAKIKKLTEENERLENALVEQCAENVMLCREVKHARADNGMERNLEMLKSGALGDTNSPETLLRYWKMQAKAGYPYASENVKYFEDMVRKEREGEG